MKWRLFYATIPRGWYEVAGKISNHEGVVIRKGSFGKMDKMVIFEEKALKEISYLFNQRYIFEKKV